MTREFDFEGVFGADYLHFYETFLTDEVGDEQAELIWRVLELREGDEVLDVPCGHGRIANRLAARGARVTGLDANEAFLDRARADALARGVDVEYVHGDMRELAWEGRFDALLCWFTSFGYFDDAANEDIAGRFRRALKDGGRAIVEVTHRDRIARHAPGGGRPYVSLTERGDDLLVDTGTFDAGEGVVRTQRITVRDGRVRRAHYTVRVYSATEIRDLLRRVGFSEVTLLDEAGEPFAFDSRRLLVTARA